MSKVVTRRRTVMMCIVGDLYIFIETFFPQVFTREKIVGQVTREDKSFEKTGKYLHYIIFIFMRLETNFCIRIL